MKIANLILTAVTFGFGLSASALPNSFHCMSVDPSKISASLVKKSENDKNSAQYDVKISNNGSVSAETYSAIVKLEYLPGQMIQSQTLTLSKTNQVFQHSRYSVYSSDNSGMLMFNNLPTSPGEMPREFVTCLPYGSQTPN